MTDTLATCFITSGTYSLTLYTSDHRMVISFLYKAALMGQYQASSCKQHKNQKLIFSYDRMTPDKWLKFKQHMDSLINNLPLLGFTDDKAYTTQDLNFYWS